MSDFFCIAPWKHLYLHTTGEVKTCCVGQNTHGSTKENTLEEIFHSSNYNKLRSDFLLETRSELISENCKRCIEMEENNIHSLRESLNTLFSQDIEDVKNRTSIDGGYPEYTIEYLDARFSNLCNFKCRMCSNEYSSSIYAEHILAHNLGNEKPYIFAGKTRENLLEQILAQVNNFKKVYFAGGEPLIQWEHWALLEEIIKQGKTDTEIVYNTNLSNLSFKGKQVTDYWNKLKNVLVLASLDGMGDKIEYWRKGTDWQTICDNLNTIKQNNPHVRIGTTTTIGWPNLYNALDFIEFCMDTGFVDYKLININVLREPESHSVTTLPKHKKHEVERRVYKTLDKIRSLRENEVSLLERNLEGLITFMYSKDTEDYMKKFFGTTKQTDKIRNESFFDVFPEHSDLKVYYNE